MIQPDPLTAVYTERAHLVAALSKLFPASIEDDPREPDWAVCLIDLPTGQVSWHIAHVNLYLFSHLPRHAGRVWDGHTDYDKYRRLDALAGYWAWPNPTLSPAEQFRREYQNDPEPTGIPDSHCTYDAPTPGWCNKCGRKHDGQQPQFRFGTSWNKKDG